jgi:hypothetical protein
MVIGVVLFISSLIFMIRIAFKQKGFSGELAMSIFLTILSIGWIALGVYAFIVIQSQLMT